MRAAFFSFVFFLFLHALSALSRVALQLVLAVAVRLVLAVVLEVQVQSFVVVGPASGK